MNHPKNIPRNTSPLLRRGFRGGLLLVLYAGIAHAQFAPQVGVSGSTAIPALSQFAGWATGCTVQRGYLDIAQPGLGKTTTGDTSMAIGAQDHSIMSLGDSGVAVLTFSAPLYNGAGADFAVFENGFQNPANPEEAFLELAFVEVSSDGVNYTRFPATSNTPLTAQVPMAGVFMDARLINNLAGKYISGYGTPFDLQELAGMPGLDINHITHVRIVDAIGAIGTDGSKDHLGNNVNDPYPTAIPTGGFDLDAVGAIYQVGMSIATQATTKAFTIYPNPASDNVFIDTKGAVFQYMLTDVTGKALQTGTLDNSNTQFNINNYPQGIYYLQLQDRSGSKWEEKIIKI